MTATATSPLSRSHTGRPRPLDGARPLALAPRRIVPAPIPSLLAREAKEGRRSDPRPVRRRRDRGVAVALAVVAGLVLAVIWIAVHRGPEQPGPGEAFVTVHGQAIVTRADGGTERVDGRVRLGAGDRIQLRSGTATFEMADEVTLAGRAAHGSAGTEVVMGRTPTLVAGPLLAETPVATTFVVEGTKSTIELRAGTAARLSRTTATNVGIYRGAATLRSAGRTTAVADLREAEIVGVGELTSARPLAYNADDPWDRAHLAAAIELDESLSSLTSGIVQGRIDRDQLTEHVRTTLRPVPTTATVSELIAGRRADADRSIALAVAGSAPAGLRSAWADVIAFRDAGAAWGLVALDVEAPNQRIIDALFAAVEDTPVAPPGSEADRSAAEGGSAAASGDPEAEALPGVGAEAGSAPDPSMPGGADPSTPEAPGTPITVPPLPPVAPTLPVIPTVPSIVEPLAPVVEGTGLAPTVDGVTTGLGATVDGLTGTVESVPVLGGVLQPVTTPVGQTVNGLLGKQP